MQSRNHFGELAQATMVQRAMAHGLRVADPFGNNDPFDYLVGTAQRFWRVQVKGSRSALYNNTYQVNVGHQTGQLPDRRAIPYTAEEIDFLAVWLADEDTWYIIPVDIVEGRVGLSFHARLNPKFGRWMPYFEAWDLLKQTGEKIVLPEDEPNARSPRRYWGRGGGRNKG